MSRWSTSPVQHPHDAADEPEHLRFPEPDFLPARTFYSFHIDFFSSFVSVRRRSFHRTRQSIHVPTLHVRRCDLPCRKCSLEISCRRHNTPSTPVLAWQPVSYLCRRITTNATEYGRSDSGWVAQMTARTRERRFRTEVRQTPQGMLEPEECQARLHQRMGSGQECQNPILTPGLV